MNNLVRITDEREPMVAVRSVSETDDVHVIEGLAYPFRGKDTYGTYFSARTDFHWDLFPDLNPGATRSTEPSYVRPVTMHHGFDSEFGLSRIGGWSPVRTDADGVWVKAALDKGDARYATRTRPLLDAHALGLSGGSAEHSVRIDQRSGEILDWPAYELALTPVESNPLAQIATRAGSGTVTIIDSARAAEKIAAGLEVLDRVRPGWRSDVAPEPAGGPVVPRVYHLAVSAATPGMLGAARAAGVVLAPADLARINSLLDKRTAHYDRMTADGSVDQRAALRETRRLLTDKARRRGIRIPAVFGSDADAVSWLRARLTAHTDGGDAA